MNRKLIGGGLLLAGLAALFSRRQKTVFEQSDELGEEPEMEDAPQEPETGDPFDVLAREAPRYGIEPRVARAVMEVEAGGKPFGSDGKVIIRFEPHVFVRRLAQKRRQDVSQMPVVLNPGMAHVDDGRSRHGGQPAEWETLGRAREIDDDVALLATSFGLGQIMGFNHKIAGYDSPQAMLVAFSSSAREQVLGMLRFIAGSPRLLSALKARDFPRFVAGYNGAPIGSSGNDRYVSRMRSAYDRLA